MVETARRLAVSFRDGRVKPELLRIDIQQRVILKAFIVIA
jgi:hypothetical protein